MEEAIAVVKSGGDKKRVQCECFSCRERERWSEKSNGFKTEEGCFCDLFVCAVRM